MLYTHYNSVTIQGRVNQFSPKCSGNLRDEIWMYFYAHKIFLQTTAKDNTYKMSFPTIWLLKISLHHKKLTNRITVNVQCLLYNRIYLLFPVISIVCFPEIKLYIKLMCVNYRQLAVHLWNKCESAHQNCSDNIHGIRAKHTQTHTLHIHRIVHMGRVVMDYTARVVGCLV